ncbi:MAG: hypothetical protein JXB85_02075 [Anaerolineales bacterium]|nr:hypothetical protein [Anaerolineales bacterium]
MNQRLDPDVRATVPAMIGQVDAVGQITGGLAKNLSGPAAFSLCGELPTPAIACPPPRRKAQQSSRIKINLEMTP